MRATGITRAIDQFGRVVLPSELRRVMNVAPGDVVEFYTDPGAIIIKKYEITCVFCSQADDLVEFEGKKVCPECLEKLKKL